MDKKLNNIEKFILKKIYPNVISGIRISKTSSIITVFLNVEYSLNLPKNICWR